MKRKLVKQGNNALTITLPKQWLDRYNLKPGNEVYIKQGDPELIITAKYSDEDKIINVNLDEIKEIIPRYLHCLYRQGINEIHLSFSSSSLMDDVHKTISENIIGYEVVEQHEKKAIIKSVAEIKEGNFENMFRRTFRITESMAESVLNIIKIKNFSEINSALYLEKVNNKLTNFCRRSVTKRLYEGQEKVLIYGVIESLERVADNLKFALEYIKKEQKNIKITESEIKLAREVLEFFKLTHQVFYHHDFKSFYNDAVKRKHLVEETLKTFQKATKKDFLIMHYLIAAFNYTVHIWSYKLQIYLINEC